MQVEETLPTRQPATAKPDAQAQKVAREFEAMFTSYMMRAMRNTVQRSDFIPESTGEKIYTEMLDDEYGNLMANNGSLGLDKLVLEQLAQDEASRSAIDDLRKIGGERWATDPRFVPRSNESAPVSSGSSVSRWKDVVAAASARYGVDPDLVTAVITQESAGNPQAVSKAGAKGLMQLMDSTAHDLGVRRVFDPVENVNAGTRYLKSLLQRFDGNEKLALASYNAGPTAVEQHNGIPPFPETQGYVANVLRLRSQLAQQTTEATPNE
jgi:soluble lytic murein transglycosylase-like protein